MVVQGLLSSVTELQYSAHLYMECTLDLSYVLQSLFNGTSLKVKWNNEVDNVWLRINIEDMIKRTRVTLKQYLSGIFQISTVSVA